MTRTLPRSLAGIVEDLELDQPAIVTLATIAEIAGRRSLRSEPKLLAARLRNHGWLLPTGVRGAWEFAPGAHAGPYGRGDPFMTVHAVLCLHPDLEVVIALGTAAWAHGYADRLPTHPELASPRGSPQVPAALARLARVTTYTSRLEPVVLKGIATHRVESVLVQLAEHPSDVRSWSSVQEWLPALAADADVDLVLRELAGRPKAARVRLGYLMQTLRPDIAEQMKVAVTSKVWFGPRARLRRHCQAWQVADTVLPFDPAELEPVSEARR